MNPIDVKILELRKLTSNFLYIEYYSHTNCECYKLDNEYTKFRKDALVLNTVEEGIEAALDLAINLITRCKHEYYKKLLNQWKH